MPIVNSYRPRLMHDGESLTLDDAILRHKGEAGEVTAICGRSKDKENRIC
jgi:hypothetical protein